MEAIGAVSNIAGIISVGIQVCEGLVNYYNAWKGSKKENATMIRSIESLLESLALLNGVLESPAFDKSMAINVESKILDCEDSIDELHEELKKIMVCKPRGADEDGLVDRKGHDNLGFRDKVTEQGRRLLYPFRKSTLLRLQENVEQVKGNLALAMDTLNLSTVSTTAERVVDISNGVATIGEGVNAIITQQMDKESINVLKWLSPIDCHTKQREVLSRRQPGTGEWLFESHEFQSWVDGKEPALWCSGSPGAGKTVLASAIIDYLEKRFSTSNVGVAFIYCDYAEKRTITQYLASIVQQLIRQRLVIPDYVLDLYHKHRSMGTVLNQTESSNVLRALTHSFPDLYIVVDALDECEVSKKTKENLIKELQSLPGNTHLLYTSRRLGDIEEVLSGIPHLEIKASDADVRAYLQSRIDSEENIIKFCKKDPTLRATIVDKIAEKAHGMFLLAHMHIEAIASELKISRVRKALISLPEVLDNSYDEAMKRILEGQDTNRKNLAMNILMWLSCAKRPMTVRELQHALAIMELDPEDDELDEDDFYDQDLLLTVCAGLVVIDPETSIIRLCHYTVQEYFERHQPKLFPGAHVTITKACIRYLSLDVELSRDPDSAWHAYVKRRRDALPLLSYATHYWGMHAQGTAEIELTDTILEFLNDEILVQNAYYDVVLDSVEPKLKSIPAIVAAAAFGLPAIVDNLLQSGVDVEITASHAITPLLIAAQRGHASVVSRLIAANTNVWATNEFGQNALHKAAYKGYADIARQLILAEPLLIKSKKDVDDEDPLDIAINGRHEAVIKILVLAGIDVNAPDTYGFTALQKVAARNLGDMIDLFVSKGAQIEATNDYSETALSMAAGMGNTEPVKRLLKAGAKVDSGKDTFRGTPLVCAASSGHKDVVDVLIEAGADVNVMCCEESVLSHAFLHTEALKSLLRAGAKMETRNKDGETVLHKVAKVGREDCVQIFMEAGADVNAKNKDGLTPLDVARLKENRGPHEEVVRLLMGG